MLRKESIPFTIVDDELSCIDNNLVAGMLRVLPEVPIVAISAMTTNYRRAIEIASLFKTRRPDCIVVFGGIHPTVLPEDTLRSGVVDYVAIGEADRTFPQLVRAIRSGAKPDTVPGIAFLDNGVFLKTASVETDGVEDLPAFPYDLFDNHRYDLGFILTSRGCPHGCTFCSQRAVSRRRYRAIPVPQVLDELEYLIRERGQRVITFFDDYFTADRKRVDAICRGIRERGLHRDCEFFAQTRGDSVDEELLRLLKDSGFTSLMFGFESSSEKVMKAVAKGETVEDNRRAALLAKKHGFETEATFIFGLPEETFEDRVGAVHLAWDAALDRARFNNATPYPGTVLHDWVAAKGRLQVKPYWDNFSSTAALISKIGDGQGVPWVPEGMTGEELVGQVLLANMLFYIRPGRMKRLFNSSEKASAKWFLFRHRDWLNPLRLWSLVRLCTSLGLRTLYYLAFAPNTIPFLWRVLVRR